MSLGGAGKALTFSPIGAAFSGLFGGGGGGGGGGDPKVPQEVQNIVQQLLESGEASFEQGLPLIEAGGADALEILRGGIPESIRPAILAATEQGRAGASAEGRNLFENLVRGGVTGSEFVGQTGAQELSAGERVADIPTTFTLPVFQGATEQAAGLTGEGLNDINTVLQILSGSAVPGRQPGGVAGGLSGAASGAVSGASLGSLFPGIGTLAGAGIGGLAGGFLGSR